MVRTIKSKKAIAMIELIFALVIMGIVLLSAPMLIQQSIKSSNIALQQEAIVAAASQTSIVLSMHWDENNSNTQPGESPILRVNRTAPASPTMKIIANGMVVAPSRPVPYTFPPKGLTSGVVGRNTKEAGGTTLLPSTTLGPDLNQTDVNETDYTKFDDVDDYANSSFGLILFNKENTSADIGEYVDTNISIATTVNYTQENAVSSSTGGSVSNVKYITVNLTNNQNIPELEKNITMKAFSCNIGTYAIYGKELP